MSYDSKFCLVGKELGSQMACRVVHTPLTPIVGCCLSKACVTRVNPEMSQMSCIKNTILEFQND